MKNLLFLLAFFLLGSKLQAQSGLTFNRVVVIDTTLSKNTNSLKYSPPKNTVWKIESIFGSNTGTTALIYINGIEVGSPSAYLYRGSTNMNLVWLTENDNLQFRNTYTSTGTYNIQFLASILEFKVD